MEKEKYKMYSLYASLSYEDACKYTAYERAKAKDRENKRGLLLMYGERIEYLDSLTSNYESMNDLLSSYTEEVYGKKTMLYNPMIIVDKDPEKRDKSYTIDEIVFKDDAIALKDTRNIREQLKEYLLNNPGELVIKKEPEVNCFRGISKISTNIKNKYPGINLMSLVEGTLNKYFENDNYKRYREAYFTLKKLLPERVKPNGIHR